MCRRLAPLVALDGDFFDTSTLLPCGDIVIESKYVYDGCIGPAFIIPKDGSPARIVCQNDYDQLDKRTLRLGMQTGPTLVRNGKIALNLRSEGFHISGCATRMALGLTADHKLVIVAINAPVSFAKLATTMLVAGCTSAVCLDGGSSSALFAEGKIRVSPGRKLVSLLVVFSKN